MKTSAENRSWLSNHRLVEVGSLWISVEAELNWEVTILAAIAMGECCRAAYTL